jgi:hypothetical protein
LLYVLGTSLNTSDVEKSSYKYSLDFIMLCLFSFTRVFQDCEFLGEQYIHTTLSIDVAGLLRKSQFIFL